MRGELGSEAGSGQGGVTRGLGCRAYKLRLSPQTVWTWRNQAGILGNELWQHIGKGELGDESTWAILVNSYAV